jgi:YbbR domain-containing protein
VTFKETISNNAAWKIGGIILALMLWIHLTTEKNYEGTFTADIEFEGLSDGFYVDKIEPASAEILIIGTGKQLALLSVSNNPGIKIDLSSVKEAGTYKYDITILEIYNIDPHEYIGVDFPSGDYCNVSIKRKI